VALTRPFEFEGLRKLEQADALIEALQVRWQPCCTALRSSSCCWLRALGPCLNPARSRPASPAGPAPRSARPAAAHRRRRLPFRAPSPQDISQLVVVVNQGILPQASKELTIAQASTIADNTLEYTIRAILWSLRAPEILVGAQGERCGAAAAPRWVPGGPGGSPAQPRAGAELAGGRCAA
jgi:hypothetical protein